MIYRNIFRGMTAVMLVILATSFTFDISAEDIDPEGTWEYSAPTAPEGYGQGKMTVEAKEDGYSVSMALNEYSKADGEKVEYEDNTIRFSVWVESEEVKIKVVFEGESLKGTASYSGGVIDITGKRVKE